MITVYVTTRGRRLNRNFCLSIGESDSVKVMGVFYTLKECRKKLTVCTPNVLLLGLDFSREKWIEFCEDVRNDFPSLKILAIVTYDQYVEFKDDLNRLTSGYISKDALPKVIVSAIDTVMAGKFFHYDKAGTPTKEEHLEWLETMIKETDKNIEDNKYPEMIEKFSQIIDTAAKLRGIMFKNLLAEENDHLDSEHVDHCLMLLVENAIFNGHSNWEIVDLFGINIATVRLYRMKLITRITGKDPWMIGLKKNGDPVTLTPCDRQVLRLIAAGYSIREIANILYQSVEAIRATRFFLIHTFEAKNNIMMVMKALRMGLLKMEDL